VLNAVVWLWILALIEEDADKRLSCAVDQASETSTA